MVTRCGKQGNENVENSKMNKRRNGNENRGDNSNETIVVIEEEIIREQFRKQERKIQGVKI